MFYPSPTPRPLDSVASLCSGSTDAMLTRKRGRLPSSANHASELTRTAAAIAKSPTVLKGENGKACFYPRHKSDHAASDKAAEAGGSAAPPGKMTTHSRLRIPVQTRRTPRGRRQLRSSWRGPMITEVGTKLMAPGTGGALLNYPLIGK